MNEKPDNLEEKQTPPLIPHPVVWWVLWIGILCCSMTWKSYARLNGLTPLEGRWQYAGEQAIVTSVVILFLLGTVVIRWMVFNRLGTDRKRFAFFIAGLALAFGAFGVATFFYKTQAPFYIIYFAACLQYFPLFLPRKSHSPSAKSR